MLDHAGIVVMHDWRDGLNVHFAADVSWKVYRGSGNPWTWVGSKKISIDHMNFE